MTNPRVPHSRVSDKSHRGTSPRCRKADDDNVFCPFRVASARHHGGRANRDRTSTSRGNALALISHVHVSNAVAHFAQTLSFDNGDDSREECFVHWRGHIVEACAKY